MSSAKEEVLKRIRTALHDVQGRREEDYAGIQRNYTQAGNENLEQRLSLFTDRLRDYDATVYDCQESQIAETVARALSTREKNRMLVPSGVPEQWLPRNFDFFRGDGLDFDEIDKHEGVITGCALAIALTGTIVLRHSSAEGRRALTLIPDYHLCIVRAEQVVQSVPEAIRKTNEFATAPITTISGPSATADIEMTRIKGVHGPRTLDVILVHD